MITPFEKKILEQIHIASENDPKKPKFPSDSTKFPATPTFRINVTGFSNVWVKDESKNPTGTHKDRMAWEIIVTYRDFLLAKKAGHVVKKLQTIGCDIYQTDLSKKALSSKDILALTENPTWFDITSNEALDPTKRFYDWLCYEIINHSPEYCFIPFGTGNLYQNILNISKKEVSGITHDPRFQGKVKSLQKCHFIGVTTNNPLSKAHKLYSPHLPFSHFDEQWIRFYHDSGFCENQSYVHLLQEEYLEQASQIALKNNIT